MPTLGAPLDLAKYEARQLRAHQLGTAPSTPVTGQLYYNTADNTLYWWDGTVWASARGGVSSTPPATTSTLGTIQLAGDLAGTATSPQIAAGVITDADVATANKDGLTTVASLRTLGSGAQQAAPGNDARFGSGGPPTGTAGGDLSGTYPNPQILAGAIVDADVATANKDGAVGVPSLRTIGTGALQAMAGNTRLDTIAIPTATVNLNNQRMTGLQTPTQATDATTKAYVDAFDQGLDVKLSCRVATTANVNLSSAPTTIDGVALNITERVLVKNQTLPAENGIYTYTGSAAIMVRGLDADASAEVTPGMFTFVEEGTTNADTGWVLTTNAPITLGTTGLTFVQFSGAGAITAGNGLTQTGTTIDVVGTVGRITVAADAVDIASTYVGQGTITTVGTLVTGAWQAATIGVLYGGTGATTGKGAREGTIAAAGYYNNAATHGAGTTISITAATHGLRATRALLVQVQDNTTGAVELPDIVVAATGDVTVTYGVSVSANSKMVTVIG